MHNSCQKVKYQWYNLCVLRESVVRKIDWKIPYWSQSSACGTPQHLCHKDFGLFSEYLCIR